MPVIPIHDVGSIGYVPDAIPHELPPAAWTYARNIRFHENRAHKFLGHQSIFATASADPYWTLSITKGGNLYWVYAGLSDVYATDGTTHKEISQTTGAYNATEDIGWTGGILGGVPILNNGVDTPQMWNPVDFGTPLLLSDLTAWPAATTAKVIRVFGNYLIALDVTKSGTSYPHMVKWSHPAAVGAIPDSWDETDATKDAGENELGTTSGKLVDCAQMRDFNLLYKEDAMWGQQQIRAPLIFRFWPITESVGAMTRRCIQEYRGRHFVFGFDDIVVNDGQRVESIVNNRMRRWLFSIVDADKYNLAFTSLDRERHEVWFCFARTGAPRPDIAAVYNIRDNVLGVRDLPEVADISWGILDTATPETWNSDLQIWNADTTVWNERLFDAASGGFLGAMPGTAANRLIRFNDGNTLNGTNMTSTLERTGLALVGIDREGNPRVDFDSVKFVRAVRPKLNSTGPVNIYVGSQMDKNDPVSWEGPVSFDPSTDFEAFFGVSGRLIAVKFESTTDISWSLDGYDLDIEVTGRY